ALSFDDFHSQTTFGADVNGLVLIFAIEWIGGDHYARALRVDSFLNQHRHEYLHVIDARALTRFVSFKVPHRGPYKLDCLDQLFVTADVWHRGIQSGAIKVWQVFTVSRAAREYAPGSELVPQASENLDPQLCVHGSPLDLLTHSREISATIRRIVDELLVVQHLINFIVQLVVSSKF